MFLIMTFSKIVFHACFMLIWNWKEGKRLKGRNLPCQIYVVKEDKEPLQSFPATDISQPIRGGA